MLIPESEKVPQYRNRGIRFNRAQAISEKLNPDFAIEWQNPHACLSGRQVVPPMATATAGQAGLTPLTPKRCVAARRAKFPNEKFGFKIQG